MHRRVHTDFLALKIQIGTGVGDRGAVMRMVRGRSGPLAVRSIGDRLSQTMRNGFSLSENVCGLAANLEGTLHIGVSESHGGEPGRAIEWPETRVCSLYGILHGSSSEHSGLINKAEPRRKPGMKQKDKTYTMSRKKRMYSRKSLSFGHERFTSSFTSLNDFPKDG